MLKLPAPVNAMLTRCGIGITGEGKKPTKGDRIIGTDGLCWCNCIECMRDFAIELRLTLWHLRDMPETRWLAGGDTGISAKTIWEVMTGIVPPEMERVGIPHDPDDFMRCHRLLEEFPAWRARLPEVAARHPEWIKLVEHWDELDALRQEEIPSGKGPAHKLYARLKELGG
jgi:hypothetical protein